MRTSEIRGPCPCSARNADRAHLDPAGCKACHRSHQTTGFNPLALLTQRNVGETFFYLHLGNW